MIPKKYPPLPIMLVDDENEVLKIAEFSLQQEGINNIVKCQDSRQVMPLLTQQQFSVIILDLTMPEITGQELLPLIISNYPDIVILIITAVNEVETAVTCMKAGAYDYLVKPLSKNKFVFHIKRAIEYRDIKTEMIALKESILTDDLECPQAFSSIITQNSKMIKIFKYIEAIANTKFTILITGETGVGKDLLAEAIHQLSNRNGEFVTVNVAGLDDIMFSDTLFGHKKGAFTGADMHRKGLIEQAENGTIFLDEIGDLNQASQVKLLRLLQDGKYYPVGSDLAKISQARVIAATNQNLTALKKSGSFRKDLYYRLQPHHVHLPPLCERMDDLEILTEFFISIASQELGKKAPTPPKELFDLLKTYHFPGNVRELKGMVSDAISRHKRGILSTQTFTDKICIRSSKKFEPESPSPSSNSLSKNQTTIQFPSVLPSFREMEKMLMEEALERSHGNKTMAAKLLGVKRQALQNRLKKYTR